MIELDSGRIHVRRAKNGVDSTHPLTGKEIRALRQLRRENLQSRFVSTPNAAARGRGSSKWSAGLENWPDYLSRLIRTCLAMPAASSSPTIASTPARCSTTSATAASCTRCDILSFAPIRFDWVLEGLTYHEPYTATWGADLVANDTRSFAE